MYFVKHFACIPPIYGGLTVYTKRLSLCLCKHGYPSGAFYKTNIEGIPHEYEYLFDKMIKHGHSLYALPEIPYLLRVFRPYKIIHTHLSFNTIFCMWLVHKLQKKPLVITIHNEMISRELSGLNFIDKRCLRSLFNDKTVQTITVNDKAKKLLQEKRFVFKNTIKVIPAYIKPVEIGNISDYLSENLVDFIRMHKKYIVFYAESFAFNNGVEIYGTKDCIDAFVEIHKLIPDLALVFCMPNMNNTSRFQQLKETIIENNCEKMVFWQTSAITEMWALLKSASVYLRTTSTDGDSVMLREALGLGVASLASDVVTRPISCRTYKFGDLTDLVAQLYNMLNTPTTQTSNEDDFFKEIMDVYKSLLMN